MQLLTAAQIAKTLDLVEVQPQSRFPVELTATPQPHDSRGTAAIVPEPASPEIMARVGQVLARMGELPRVVEQQCEELAGLLAQVFELTAAGIGGQRSRAAGYW